MLRAERWFTSLLYWIIFPACLLAIPVFDSIAPLIILFVFVVILLPAVMFAKGMINDRRALTAARGLCLHCGYDLRASPWRCPECGRVPQSRVPANLDPTWLDPGGPLSPDVREAISLAVGEAADLRHDYLGTEHLILGILRSRTSPAARILSHSGVTYEDTRFAVAQLVVQSRPIDKGKGDELERSISATPAVQRALGCLVATSNLPCDGVHLLRALLDEESAAVSGLLPDVASLRARLDRELADASPNA